MQADLPETYYLDNVITLFNHVETVYHDILEPDYREFLNHFSTLPEDSKKLYIRLLNRNGEWFRLSKLNYLEIHSIPQAIQPLQQNEFLKIDNEPEIENILALFNKAEIIKLHPDKKEISKLSRQQLNEYILNSNTDFLPTLLQKDSFLKINHKQCYSRIQMIFFGNLNQSMTDFVLRDLGLYQYENYVIDIQNRPYSSSEEIQQHWNLHQLQTLISLKENHHLPILLDSFAKANLEIQKPAFLQRKAERIKFEIARQIERMGKLEQALSLYSQCLLPPSRERQARIHQQQGEFEKALKICRKIQHSPIDDAEFQFSIEFAERLIKRYKLDPVGRVKPASKYQPETIHLQLIRQDSVELAVVDYYCRNENHNCFFLENNLFNGVLGLLIWDVIFAPVQGAFHNPFQYRPGDFYEHDFLLKRQNILDNLWKSIENNNDIWKLACRRWKEKQGLMNPFINWTALNLEIIELALQRIEFSHWKKIFNRILSDLRNNRAGFPDLVLFPAEGSYKLIEVKGPGDKLQKNQQRWMSFFEQHEIPHALAQVSWIESTVNKA